MAQWISATDFGSVGPGFDPQHALFFVVVALGLLVLARYHIYVFVVVLLRSPRGGGLVYNLFDPC